MAQNTFLGAGIQQSGSASMNIGGDVNFGVGEDRCLADLRLTDPRLDKKRIEDTKGGLLRDIYQWVLEHRDYRQWRFDPDMRLLWIRGDPGKGKTMLICGIIDDLARAQTNMAYFFCQATDSRLNTVTAVLRGLIFSLCSQNRSLLKYLEQKYEEAGTSLFDDVNGWVAMSEILTLILGDPTFRSGVTLVVDGLDECVGDLPRLLTFITKTLHLPHVKWAVSSRNWPSIEEPLALASHKITLRLELNDDSVGEAVDTYIRMKVSSLARQKRYNDYLRQSVESYLLSKANGTFLWVALVCDKLSQAPVQITGKILKTFPPGLDDLYHRMLNQIFGSALEEICKSLLAVVCVTYRPLSLDELHVMTSRARGLELAEDDLQLEGFDYLSEVKEAVSHCGSFLTVRDNTVFFVHQTAQAFLLQQPRGTIFSLGVQEQHQIIYLKSLDSMTQILRRNIYDIDSYGPVTINDCRPESDPLAAMAYCCVYWIDHLLSGMHSRFDFTINLKGFLETKLLNWLEALVLLGEFDYGLRQMLRLERQIELYSGSWELGGLVYDITRFMRSHDSGIKESPLQLYISCLLFSPARSMVRTLYQQEIPKWVQTVAETDRSWDSCLLTKECEADSGVRPCFFPDGSRFLCAISPASISIIETETGTRLQTLGEMRESNEVRIKGLRLSLPDCRFVAASLGLTVEIWDLNTSNRLRLIQPGKDVRIRDLAFDPSNNRHLVLTSGDSISVWDIDTGGCIQDLQIPNAQSMTIHFIDQSAPILFFSSRRRGGILTGGKLNIRTLECLITPEWSFHDTAHGTSSEGQLTYHRQLVCHERRGFVLGSSRTGIQVRELCTGNRVYSFNAPIVEDEASSNGMVEIECATLSPTNNNQLGYSLQCGRIVVVDIRTSAILHIFNGFVSRQLAFSPNGCQLLSFGSNGNIKVWDLSSRQEDLAPIGIEDDDLMVSQDGGRVATISKKRTTRVWEATPELWSQVSVVSLAIEDDFYQTGYRSIAFTPDFSRVAWIPKAPGIAIHDLNTGKLHYEQDDHDKPALNNRHSFRKTSTLGLEFGPGGTILAVAYPTLLQLWHLESHVCHSIPLNFDKSPIMMQFSSNGSRLAVISVRGDFDLSGMRPYVQMIDVLTGNPLNQFFVTDRERGYGHSPWIDCTEIASHTAVWMSSIGGRIACFSNKSREGARLEVKDLSNGECLLRKDFGQSTAPNSWFVQLQFAEDGNSLSWPSRRLSSDFTVVDIKTGNLSGCENRPWGSSTLLNLNRACSWIMLKGKPIFWVPLDFRKNSIQIRQGTIVLRKRPDHVSILRVSDPTGQF